MDHDGHRERLRERFVSSGLEAFAPHEMLELLLTYAIPRRDTNALAHTLLTRFGSLHAVLQATPEELQCVDGIGENAAVLLSMMVPLFRQYRKSIENETPEVNSPEQSIRYCESLFEGERFEKFYVICLDGHMKRLNTVLISRGDITEVHVYARHILSALTQCDATGAIITHNHPDGEAAPSSEDIRLTQGIRRVLEGVGISLYDHLIVGRGETFSFLRGGLLK